MPCGGTAGTGVDRRSGKIMGSKKEGRVFLRELVSQKYGMTGVRKAQLEAPRVRSDEVVTDDGTVGHYGMSKDTSIWWRLAPGDDPFLTQTLQVHFVRMEPHSANAGHGHQNEAVFYILSGHGHEIHDDERHEWTDGDLVVVHTDSVHRHFNDSDEPAIALVIKPKALWMYLGLIQQGQIGGFEDPEGRYGEREDWTRVWTPGTVGKQKIVTPSAQPVEDAAPGRIRRLAGKGRDDVRLCSMDIHTLEIEAGGASSRHWRMGDEVIYVISGQGESVHWEVEADIDERFHARVPKEPSRHPIRAGDVLWVPQNTIRKHINTGDEPLVLLCSENAMFRHLGYDNTYVFEPATGGS